MKIEHENFIGYGEACLPKYLGENTEDTLAFLEKAKVIIDNSDFSYPSTGIFRKIDALSAKNNAAKAAIDIALMDLAGKVNNKPFYELAGIGASGQTITSCTIGIDDEAMIAQKIKEADEFQILKIKAGTKNDDRLINLIRSCTDKPLYVDVNQGWNDKHYVVDMIAWMKEKGVLLIEQPMPVTMQKEMAWVTERSSLPVIADESVKRLDDLKKINSTFSGVNIKLMKCAGLNEAIEMIKLARQKDLKVMLGCMAESSCATTAISHLVKLADFVDLDAPVLITNDPFNGIRYKEGYIMQNTDPGIGVSTNEKLPDF